MSSNNKVELVIQSPGWLFCIKTLCFECEVNFNLKEFLVLFAIVLHLTDKEYLFPKEVRRFDLLCRLLDKTNTFSTSNKSFFLTYRYCILKHDRVRWYFIVLPFYLWTIDEFETGIKYSYNRPHKKPLSTICNCAGVPEEASKIVTCGSLIL